MQNPEQAAEEAKIWYQSVNWQGVIDRLAEGLGTTGEYLWEVLVEGTVISGWTSLAVGMLYLLIFGMIGSFGIRQLRTQGYTKESWEQDGSYVRFWMTGVAPTLALFICCLVLLSHAKDVFMEIGAPEYKAIEFVISQVKN
jgi:hypothetical protein